MAVPQTHKIYSETTVNIHFMNYDVPFQFSKSISVLLEEERNFSRLRTTE